MSTILHAMQTWLPLSEQFVHALVTGSRHRGIVLARLPVENRRTFPHRPVLSLGAIPASWPQTAWQRRTITAAIMIVARTCGARVIHYHHGYRLGDLAGPVRRLGLPLVVSLHGHDVTAYAREYPALLGGTLPLASAVIVPSQFTVPLAVALGAAKERVHVIPSGVDVRWFSPTPLPDEPEILFAGRFVEKKGIDVLLKAWSVVREAVRGARLRLLGSGPLEPLARSGGPGVEVQLTDPARRATQMRDAIRRARLVVTPSRTAADGDVETLLLVNLETQACGRPLVTTRHGGIPEYVDDGRTGLLVPENDADALADAMLRLLTDDRLARTMAAAGPAWAGRFDARDCTARVDDLYDSLLA